MQYRRDRRSNSYATLSKGILNISYATLSSGILESVYTKNM